MDYAEEVSRYPLEVVCPVHPDHGVMVRSVPVLWPEKTPDVPYYACRVCVRAWKVDHGAPVRDGDGQPVEHKP